MSQHKDGALRPRTEVITRGFDPALSVGSARPAVFRSSTYVFPSPEAAEYAFDVVSGRKQAREGERADLIYARFNHPNAEILEDQIVPLEHGAKAALVFNSGMAAIMTTFMTFSRPGSTVVFTVPLYGGTAHLIHDFLEPLGWRSIGVPAGRSQLLADAIKSADNPSIVFIETPANPTLTMTDIRRAVVAAAEHPAKPIVVVDNTLLGPIFQHPLDLGADLVLYSATKYLSGFSDMIAGAVLGRDPGRIKQLFGKRGLFGNILPPDECWMLDGRLPTVALRMNRQSKNAQRLAEHLVKHPRVKKVFYPSLFEDAEQVRIRTSQCEYPGAMISLELGTKEAAFEFLRTVKIAHNAVSLGGVETLVCHPKTTTHSGLSKEELDLAGVTDGLVRISVGVEDWRDLVSDIEQALDAVPVEALAR
jgi:cystathionine beta-lyase/cystathionine gamma-synthase